MSTSPNIAPVSRSWLVQARLGLGFLQDVATAKSGFKCLLTVLFILASVPGIAAASEGHWVFKVYLDKKEIGYHEFKVEDSEEERQVNINAQFDVKVLFINAYSYAHQNLETWNDGCLQSIDALTDDNGDESLVSGSRSDAGFALQTTGGTRTLEAGCLRSFAYWDPSFLRSERLLNAQTGELVDVDIRSRGLQALQIGNLNVEAEKYEVAMEDGIISLWYGAADGRWLALEAPAKGGRTIRYEPVTLPGTPQDGADRLAMN